ncbi:MAG: TlyA family RNA methyltransferase [Actinomycetota bacterium]
MRRGFFGNLDLAAEAISRGSVLVDGATATSAASMVPAGAELTIARTRAFVSRGGDKLAGALEDLNVDPGKMRCLDAGAGSGGFTDCLLKTGASEVVAVDVGYGQFDWSLRNDPRVRLLERTNLRTLTPAECGAPFDLIVADLSFTSVASHATKLAAMAGPGGRMLLLIKPQHESPKETVGPGGVVTDPSVWRLAIESAAEALSINGFGTVAVAASRVKGATGNQEFFVLACRGEPVNREAIAAAVEAAV